MTIQTTYSQACVHLASFMNEVIDNREVVIIQHPGTDDVAMLAADELSGVLETMYLLRSPANADRLRTALARVHSGEGDPKSIDDVRREVGL